MITRRQWLGCLLGSGLYMPAMGAVGAEPLPATCEVLVVGSGLAGLSAAYAARQAGKCVCLIEKGPLIGGHSLLSSGSIAAVSPARQGQYKVRDSVEQFVEDAWKIGGQVGNRAILTRIAEGSEEALAILEREDIQFGPPFQATAGVHPRAFAATSQGSAAGRTYVTAMLAAVVRLGAPIFFGASAAIAAETGMVAPSGDASGVVRVGLVDTFTPSFYIDVYTPLIESLKAGLPQYRFETKEISHADAMKPESVENIDFVIVSSGGARMLSRAGLQQIATLRKSRCADVSRSVGAVFLVPAGSPVQTIEDLRGRRVAATAPWSFEGWLIPQGEIARRGFDPEDFFREVTFTEWNFPDVLTLVVTGMSDAGVLPACELEQAVRTGVIQAEDVRIVGERPERAAGGCATSTELYPDLMFASSPSADPDVVKAVTVALLSMPADANGLDWLSNTRMQGVEALLVRLKIGPYAYLRDNSITALALRWCNELAVMGLVLLLLLVHHWRVNRLLKRRTAELRAEESARGAAAEALRASQENLALVERAGMASQLAAMFAHEIKQPLTSIANYLTGIRLMMKMGNFDVPKWTEALSAAEHETHRAADIIERVRTVLRKETPGFEPVDVRGLVGEALKHAGHLSEVVDVKTVFPDEEVLVKGDALELELVVVNFLKNAVRAVADLPSRSSIVVEVLCQNEIVEVSVLDEGPAVSDEVFGALGKLTKSVSKEGLGFGLFIASSIAEMHRGHLAFARRTPQGLKASLVLPRLRELNINNQEWKHEAGAFDSHR